MRAGAPKGKHVVAGLRLGLACLAFALAMGDASAGEPGCGSPEPVNTLNELWAALYACWQPPPGSAGMEITLTFSLRRDGSLIGKPRATWSRLSGSEAQRRAFVASVLAALDRQLPLKLTDSLGGAIAGRPFAMRFAAREQVPEQSL
ncbi:hypothetical protein MesoLjLc_24760 [Mesorhizobium sp. L-8-10]|uniref:hypothetical protein n=1 Tax=unclassified Mesorhizobium TaxID=325217 RepID=UPI001934BD8F|nr:MULTISPECIES: hypothetical protein [unclassified Mesorhizobium]BCH22742.1 hypothetical protein MesoLjLb_25270 [Mesorhizobium sp. L-8-3]BCH30546.1 hypothetical protein MesoLjLc_24760 [Mesorhizobium sp. L-8-10]